MLPKVSIIVPVYNVEKYLRQCLDSLLSQTLKEIEIICVNDGSTDSSPKMLKEYAKKDQRIKIINKPNGGLSSARNAGMEAAKGEYIGFVDSDDWVEKEMYQKMYTRAKKNDLDMVMCQAAFYDETTKKIEKNDYYALEIIDNSFDSRILTHKDFGELIFKIPVSACNKIYRSNFLVNSDLKFPLGLAFEDNPFFFRALLKAQGIGIVRKPFYLRRGNRQGSITASANEKHFDLVEIFRLIDSVFSEEGRLKEYLIPLRKMELWGAKKRYDEIHPNHSKQFYNLLNKYFMSLAWSGIILDPNSEKILNSFGVKLPKRIMGHYVKKIKKLTGELWKR